VEHRAAVRGKRFTLQFAPHSYTMVKVGLG
jgi:hypothetical protein